MNKSMEEARKEEFRISLEEGNHKNGKGLITVLADGSWMKRSYKNGNYNSPAGLVYIIGQRSGKILWFEIKNMYCSVCDRAKNNGCKPREHECYKNWNRGDSSNSMEPISIIEGFNKSLEKHNLFIID